MTTHTIHRRLPEGFHYADQLQTEQYRTKGIVHGARKVVLVESPPSAVSGEPLPPLVAVRLHPPLTTAVLLRRALIRMDMREQGITEDALLAWYKAQYTKGWGAARRGSDRDFATGFTTHSYDDGYLDAVAGRPKWHTTHCADHDTCGEG